MGKALCTTLTRASHVRVVQEVDFLGQTQSDKPPLVRRFQVCEAVQRRSERQTARPLADAGRRAQAATCPRVSADPVDSFSKQGCYFPPTLPWGA